MQLTLRIGSWVLVACASFVAALSLTAPVAPASAVSSGSPPGARPAAAPLPPVDSIRELVVSRDLFRTERRAADVPFDPARSGAPTDRAPAPELHLAGVVLGDGARALIEGLPGAEGARLLTLGESFAGLRVAAIGPLSVRVVSADTSWNLRLERRP